MFGCLYKWLRRAAAGLTLALSTALIAPPALAMSGPEFARRADVLLRRHLTAGDFSGVVLVATNQKILLRRAYGLANREWAVPMTTDTVFRVGSTTKQFTAAAIMQLRDAGKLSLDDPLVRYVATLPSAWAGVTIRQALSHSGGVPDYVGANGFIDGPGRLDLTPSDLVALVRTEPLRFTPGSSFAYSNTDYVLLGMVIERLSGQSFGDYLAEHVFKPLRLRATAYDDNSTVVPKRAYGYDLSGKAPKDARLLSPATAYAAGALRSTVDDLLRWNTALHSGKLLPPGSVDQMFTDQGHGYGFGSFIEKRHGHRLWDHGGNLPGFSSAFEFYPDDDLTVIVLTNVEGSGSERLAKDLAGLYFDWRQPGEKPPASMSSPRPSPRPPS